MALGDVIGKLSAVLSMDTREFVTGSTDAQVSLRDLGDRLRSIGDLWGQTGRRLSVGLTLPLGAFGVAAAMAASDAEELQSAFDTTFGNLSDEMNRWAETTGDAMGRSTQSMQQMANTFGIFFNQAAGTRAEAAKMSQTFTVLAQDLSSFYNVDGDVALAKLRSGLSGESEPLRDFGVFLTEAAVKAKAFELGLVDSSGEISEQAKILARYQLILEGTTAAQGDVARTADGTANSWRAFTEALQELRVEIGERLLPVLTPVIRAATGLVNAFSGLPEGVKTAIVAFGALAASIGPVMLLMGTLAATVLPLFAAKFGPIGLAISAIVNPLGTVISLLINFVAQLGAMTILQSIGGMLLRFAGPLGLVAAAGTLIYQNWDEIAGVFEEFWAAAKQALGPPLQELIATLSAAFDELWNGPLGADIREAMALLREWAGVVGAVFGGVVIGTLRAFLDTIVFIFEGVGSAIRVVNALLKGDWQAAWNSAIDVVRRVTAPFNFLISLTDRVAESVRKLMGAAGGGEGGGVGSALAALTNSLSGGQGSGGVRGALAALTQSVQQTGPALEKALVRPLAAANDNARELQSLLDRIYPEATRARQFREEMDLLSKSLSGAALADAESRLRLDAAGQSATGKVGLSDQVREALFGQGELGGLDEAQKSFERFTDRMKRDADTAKVTIVRTFGEMAQQTLAAFDRLAGAIKGGGFLDILSSVVGVGLQLGGAGVFGKGIAERLNAFANGTSFAPGGLALVGERGPEVVDLPRGARVTPNNQLGGMGGVVVINNSPMVDVFVDGRIQHHAPGIAEAGAQVAMSRMAFQQSRRLA